MHITTKSVKMTIRKAAIKETITQRTFQLHRPANAEAAVKIQRICSPWKSIQK